MNQKTLLILTGWMLCGWSGCQSTRLAALHPREFLPWSSADEESASGIDEQDARLAGASFDTETIHQKSFAASEDIHSGQQALAAWYQDQRPVHLEEAKSHFEKALKLQPRNNVDAHHGLAIVADLKKDFPVAEQHYQLALALSPSDSRVLGNLGYSYLLQERLDESQRYLSRAIQTDSTNHDAVRNLGDVYVRQGKTDKALATYSRVMSPADAEKLVSSYVPLNSEKSLTDRLLARQDTPPSEGQQLTAQIQNMRAERELEARRSQQADNRQRSATAMAPQATAQHPISSHQKYDPSGHPDLNSQLAAIDRESYQSVSNMPVVIDGQTGDPRQFRDRSDYSQQESTIAQQATGQGVQFHNFQQGIEQVQYSQEGERGPIINAGLQSDHSMEDQQGIQTAYYEDSTASSRVEPVAYQSERSVNPLSESRDIRDPESYADQLRRPWSGEQPASIASNQKLRNPLSGSDRQESRIPASKRPMDPLGRSEANPNVARSADSKDQLAAGQIKANPDSNAETTDAFQRASLLAALLGMGMPVQVTTAPEAEQPIESNTTPRQVPGTNSRWNGAEYPTVHRDLPTSRAPQDLKQAYNQPAISSRQQTSQARNSQGQLLNQSQVTNTPEQFGTASRYGTAVMATDEPPPWNYGAASSNGLQGEQELYNRQLNTAIRQTWDDRPMQVHQSQESVDSLRSPAEYGGMSSSGIAEQLKTTETQPTAYPHRPDDQYVHPLMSGLGTAPATQSASPSQMSIDSTPRRDSQIEQVGYTVPTGSGESNRLPIVNANANIPQQRNPLITPEPRSTMQINPDENSSRMRLAPVVPTGAHSLPSQTSSQNAEMPLIRPSGR